MDASGIVIAASEVIRFEDGCGVMFTVCNLCMNFSFYILAKDSLTLWQKIIVSHYYKFTNLKIGAIEWLSGNKNIVMVTTLKSEYHEILEHELQKFTISNYFMDKISIPRIAIISEIHPFSKMISYQGVITKVENLKLGIYELDNKVHLYCVFNAFRTLLSVFTENCKVFISNVHLLRDFQGRKILVCCGLSSVRSLQSEVEAVSTPVDLSVSYYPLSIFDIIWLEMLFMKLNTKFCPAVISNDFTFHWENEILNNILECFCYPLSEESLSKNQSLAEEYCSNPHSCNVLCDDILPTGSEILLISEILNRGSKKITWSENSDTWKTCFIENEMKYILIGMLYLSKDGCWYIKDRSDNIPIIFTRSCDQCKLFKNIFCLFESLNLGYLIALQHFQIVHEKIKFHLSDYKYYRYLKTTCCCILYIGTFHRWQNDLFSYISAQETFPLHLSQSSSIEEITQTLKCTHLSKHDTWINLNKQYNSLSPYNEDIPNNSAKQCILVLNKIWTIINRAFVNYQIIVLLLSMEEVSEKYFNKSKSLLGDSYNFYESKDDYDFAELVNQIDSLYIGNKPKLARLHFESTKQCALLLPGHIYALDVDFSAVSDVSHAKPVLIKVKPHTKILHHTECLGNHYPDDYEIDVYNNIKKVVSERKVQENCLVRAVLINKLYEESSNSNSQGDDDTSKTFCLILKDCESEDTIKVYLPFSPKNMFGFLPGIQLHMWGFVCLCSRRGYLYLKSSSSFGIQIIHSDALHVNNSILEEKDLYSEIKISSLENVSVNTHFKCRCFILKIISAKMHLICNVCEKGLMEKCSCPSSFRIKLKMSFIIDDGTDQVLAHCSDETARKILMLKENEWNRLSSYVMKTRTSLNFYYKNIENDFDSLPLIDKVFSLYCSSKSICQQICLKCKKKLDGLKCVQPSVWCYDVLQVRKTDLLSELITKVKKV